VQHRFYPKQAPKTAAWESAFRFEPLTGVSGNAFGEGSGQSLKVIMEEINRRLTAKKGAAENYATGLVLRLSDNVVKYVNAGHADLLFRSAENGQVHVVNLPDGRDFKGRFLGLAEWPSDYATLKFRVRPGDMILAYTDCRVESRNPAGEEFGLDRLTDAFARCRDQNCDAVLAWVLDKLDDFCAGTPRQDDLTAIVLPRR